MAKTARNARGDKREPRLKGDPAFFRRINYPAVLAGFVVALLVYLLLAWVLTPGGASADRNYGIYFSVSAVAMYAGGLVAGMIEPKYGVLNGPLVAVVFIIITGILTFNSELQRVQVVGPFGLGPMRVDRVFATDLPQLFFSSLGGLTAGWITQLRRPRRANTSSGKGAGKRGG
jgi:putative membrane protein (TIGR04086 family)